MSDSHTKEMSKLFRIRWTLRFLIETDWESGFDLPRFVVMKARGREAAVRRFKSKHRTVRVVAIYTEAKVNPLLLQNDAGPAKVKPPFPSKDDAEPTSGNRYIIETESINAINPSRFTLVWGQGIEDAARRFHSKARGQRIAAIYAE